jgi:hypothetical protein
MRKKWNNIFVFALTALLLWGCGKGIEPNFQGDPASAGFRSRMTYDGTNLYTVNGKDLKIFNLDNARNPVLNNEVQMDAFIQSIYSARGLVAVGIPQGFNLFTILNSEPLQSLGRITGDGAMSLAIDTPFVYAGQGKNDVFATNTGFPANGLYLFSTARRFGLIYSLKLDDVTGLAVKDSLLFVCDGHLSVYVRRDDPSDPAASRLVLKKSYSIPADNATVTVDNRLILTSASGILQCSYSEDNVEVISTIPVSH